MKHGPSKHLTWDELSCKDGTPYPTEWRSNRAIELAEIFEFIRKSAGNLPIKILSGYRTVSYNKKIGGAKHSQHLQGRALDMRPPSGMSVEEFYNLIKKLSKNTAIGGIGLYSTFVHVDTRPKNSHIVQWFGNGVKDDRS